MSRNWSAYNNQLVKRGEIYFSFLGQAPVRGVGQGYECRRHGAGGDVEVPSIGKEKGLG